MPMSGRRVARPEAGLVHTNAVSSPTGVAGGNDFQWCFSQVKGAIDEDVAEGM